MQGVQPRLRGRLLARDRARVPRVAGDPRGRDAHVLHRRARRTSRTSRRRCGSQPDERFALPLALGARLLPRAQPAAAARARAARHGRAAACAGVDLALGERRRAAAADRGRSAAHARQRRRRARSLVRVERAGDRAFALTAARVMATAAFRELFPDQALAPGRLMAVTQATLVVAQLDDAPTLFQRARRREGVPGRRRGSSSIVGALAKELRRLARQDVRRPRDRGVRAAGPRGRGRARAAAPRSTRTRSRTGSRVPRRRCIAGR